MEAPVNVLNPPLAAAPVPVDETASLSPWALSWRRFRRHKVAVLALYALAVLYTLAFGAEFFAPYPREWRRLDHAYCPPQIPRFSFADGIYVPAMKRVIDPVTFKKSYYEDASRRVALGFLVRGEPYTLWGLVSTDLHFFGIKSSADAADASGVFYPLGADKYGRDLCSRLIYGSRISLSVGLVAIAVTFLLGATIGGISGYVGGWLDNVIQRFIEILNSFPHLPLWLAIGAVLPPEWSPLTVYFAITLVLALLGWTSLARVVRGKILSLREEDYATAARLIGASHARVLFRHLLPGLSSHIVVVLTMSVPAMILGETSLSFLGLGLRPPIVSWGVLLQDCLSLQTVANYPWLLTPVVLIVLTVLCFNFLGDGIRDAADPYATR